MIASYVKPVAVVKEMNQLTISEIFTNSHFINIKAITFYEQVINLSIFPRGLTIKKYLVFTYVDHSHVFMKQRLLQIYQVVIYMDIFCLVNVEEFRCS